ncbi:MAG: hypothetical protein V4619_14445 [Bacteroidota bacterium]
MNTVDREEAINKFYIEYENKNYSKAKDLLLFIINQDNRKSFWVYSRLSSCYYELREYDKALKYATLAYRLQPKSPIVLWDYAGVLIAVKKERRAIKLLFKIQEMQDDLTIYGFSHPQKNWMRAIKNDCNFLIAKAYYIICEDELAKEYFNKYLLSRSKETIYTKKQVLTYLKTIENVSK